MINFSGISKEKIIGKLLRLPLTLLPENIKVPILQGKLRGKKWIVGSGNHGYWLGSYEYEKQSLFSKTINEGNVVYDIGAQAGFYTLLASELVGSEGGVIAFEPLPRNIKFLEEHLRINHCKNVTIIESAVAEKNGTAFFEEGGNYSMGRLDAKGSIEVKAVSLDSLVSNGEVPPPDYMKIDVEGAELSVLMGATSLISKFHPVIFLAAHDSSLNQQCCDFLRKNAYSLKSLNKQQGVDESDEILAF